MPTPDAINRNGMTRPITPDLIDSTKRCSASCDCAEVRARLPIQGALAGNPGPDFRLRPAILRSRPVRAGVFVMPNRPER